jgi:hypothetical protein
MFVGCKLPHGLTIDHNDQVIHLNGANVGYDADNPWKNSLPPDSPLRANGVGLTQLEGAQADAFKAWFDLTGKGHGPVKSGFIFFAEREAEVRKETQLLEDEKSGLEGIDPSKDLPKGLSTDPDSGAAKNKKG